MPDRGKVNLARSRKEKVPSPHSSTSSARASSDGGIVNPSALARELLEQLQPFSGETVFELHKAGDVTAGLRHASNYS